MGFLDGLVVWCGVVFSWWREVKGWMLCWCSKGGNGVGEFSAAAGGVDQSLVCGNRIESWRGCVNDG